MTNTRIRRLGTDVAVAAGLVLALAFVLLFDRPDPTVLGGPNRPSGRRGIGSLVASGTLIEDRVKERTKEFLEKRGSDPETEESVEAGLAWLHRHQAKDGSWSNRYLGGGRSSVCEEDPHCRGPGSDYAVAQTGLALLAFMAGGHFEFNDKSPYCETVRRGLDWLVKKQNESGGLFTGGEGSNYFMYEHGIAAFALAEACAVAKACKREPDKRYRTAAEKAIRHIEQAQHYDGGWRYTNDKSEGSDTSVSGWQVLALKTARDADIPVDPNCLDNVERFFKSCEHGENGRTGYTGPGAFVTDATTGLGMLVHQFLLGQPDSPLVKAGASYLADLAEGQWSGSSSSSPDYYLWYNCTLAMFQTQGTEWNRWNAVVRKMVVDLQETDDAGCARGSWPPAPSRHGAAGGRIYTTALAVLTLEVYYRYTAQTTKQQ